MAGSAGSAVEEMRCSSFYGVYIFLFLDLCAKYGKSSLQLISDFDKQHRGTIYALSFIFSNINSFSVTDAPQQELIIADSAYF